MSNDIFHSEFSPTPYWWEFFKPRDDLLDALPAKTSVAIVGGGYTGLSAALALARHGIEATVLEADEFGFGASTRNGGGVGGAINVGKSLSGKRLPYFAGEREAILAEAARAFRAIENRIATDEISCDWQLNGRFIGAWTPKHFRAQEQSLDLLNEHAELDASMVPREQQSEHLRTNLYHGGMLVSRSATINPALLYKGILEKCIASGVRLASKARVSKIDRAPASWTIETTRGRLTAERVIIATNGYIDRSAPKLRKKIIPVFSNIIVTEELPDGLAKHLFPTGLYVNDRPRIRSYFRLTPDGKRVLFGGRGRFRRGTYEQYATSLYRMMLDRLPDMRGVKVTHAWSGRIAFTFDSIPHVGEEDGLFFALGCNGSGVAMMNYLGDYLGQKIAGKATYTSQFERPLHGHRLYSGDPWFLPAIGQYFRLLDNLERHFH